MSALLSHSRMMTDDAKSQRPKEFTIRDEANALVVWAFRNGPIESLHAGEYSELLSNPSLSRITDAERCVS